MGDTNTCIKCTNLHPHIDWSWYFRIRIYLVSSETINWNAKADFLADIILIYLFQSFFNFNITITIWHNLYVKFTLALYGNIAIYSYFLSHFRVSMLMQIPQVAYQIPKFVMGLGWKWRTRPNGLFTTGLIY